MVQHQQANAAVNGIVTDAIFQFHGVGHADHAQYFAAVESAHDQLATRGVGAIGGKLPVAVAAIAIRVLEVVGMARQADAVWNIVKQRRNAAQDIAHIGLDFGAAGFKHRPVLAVDNLDAQPLFHHVDDQMRTQRFQTRIRFNQLVQLFAQAIQANVVELALLLIHIDDLFHFALDARRVVAAARNRAFAVAAAFAAGHRDLQRRFKIFGNLHQLLRAGDRDQPHHHKKGHHRRHKVGIGDLPGAVAAFVSFMLALFDDDDGTVAVLHAVSSEVCFAGFFALRTCSSSSLNEGRSVE